MRTYAILFFCFAACSTLLSQVPRLVVPIGHTAGIRSVAFSPDGRFVLTGSEDRSAILWNLDGKQIRSFQGHENAINSVAFSPGGEYVLTGGSDISARLFDVKTGMEMWKTVEHAEDITSVAFSPDGNRILTGSRDRIVKLWDRSNPDVPFREFRGHGSPIDAVAFSPPTPGDRTGGKYVLTGSRDNTAKLWDVESGKELKTFSGHTDWVLSVSFSPDGARILTGSKDNTVKLWDVNGDGKEPLRTFSGHTGRVNAAVFSPNGPWVLTASDDRTARVWSISDPSAKEMVISGHQSRVSSAAFAPDGKSVLTGSEDKTARLWDLEARSIAVFSGHSSAVYDVAWSPDGKNLLSGHSDSTARWWDMTHREVTPLAGHTGEVRAVDFSPDSRRALTASRDRTARVWSGRDSIIVLQGAHKRRLTSAAFSPDGQKVLTSCVDGYVVLWRLDGSRDTLLESALPVNAVTFSPDGNSILAGIENSSGLIYRLDTSLRIPLTAGHRQGVLSVAFSPDGKAVLTGSKDNSAILWKTNGRPDRVLPKHDNQVNAVAFSPKTLEDTLGGQFLLTGSHDQTAKLWDRSGNLIHFFAGHSAAVNSVAFSPDGRHVLTGSSDNTVKVWDSHTGMEKLTLVALEDGNWVVTDPTGLFDASPGAMSLMHFAVGQEAVELDQLKERYFEPGLLSKTMGFSDELLRTVKLDSVALYPVIRLGMDSLQRRLHISVQPREGGVGKVSVFVNGKEIIENAGKDPQDTLLVIDLTTYARFFLTDTLNTVSVRAYNRDNWLRSPMHVIDCFPVFARAKGGPDQPGRGRSIQRATPNPALHLLLVGVSNYAGTTLDLDYAAKDAENMAAVLGQAGRQLFGKDSVFMHLLTTDTGKTQPTRANVKAAFGQVAARSKAEDIFVVYFSGHGVNYGEAEKALFYFLTMETRSFDMSDPFVRVNNAISSDSLTHWINLVPAQKQVLIVDACNSGKLSDNILRAAGKSLSASQIRAMERMKDRTGMFVLSSSTADQKSWEDAGFRQSLLTYSLLEAMYLKEALDEAGDIDIMRLFQYACDQVPRLAKNISAVQVPVPAFPRGARTIVIGRVDEQVTIPLTGASKVVSRSIFQDEVLFADPLQLAKIANNYLYDLDRVEKRFIFSDRRDLDDSYSIKGLYRVEGDKVMFRGRLFKGIQPAGPPFSMEGGKSDLQELVIRAVDEALQGM